MSEEGFVEYQEASSIKVGRLLFSRGFQPAWANGVGIDQNSLEESLALGIIYDDPEIKPKSYFFGLIGGNRRRAFIGTIWFKNERVHADEKTWVIEAYGRKYVELVKQLAKEMYAIQSKAFIIVRLVDEKPRFESYVREFIGS